ncbi:putative membrane protein YhhN [Friedmanniella endophytica]|uniref:Putative membrane protein YhhN n=1 Tax=Microlunatus kandeliicorticis TaxID=1759536 RepID=A0A7W3IV77_9ACTN|nr:lysoplasmalogenase family protein [Microlunatus kandeliicorticis]MBA8795893.1 putative membrane protein YhhN [Microlunatus kandeliicorticis]
MTARRPPSGEPAPGVPALVSARRPLVARALLGAYLAVAVLELVVSDLSGAAWRWVDAGCLVALMPLLAGFLLAARPGRDRLTGWVLLALLFSWLGDTVGGVALLAKIGLFLLAQLAYVAAFRPYWRHSPVARPLQLAAVTVGVGVLVLWVGRAAGPLLPAVVLYGVALGTMAVLAGGLNRVAGLGGLVFLVSDLSLGLTVFAEAGGPLASALDLLVMPTYVVAQLLLVLGVLRRSGWGGRVGAAG